MTQYEIHVSDVLAFKSCRRKWDYSSLLRRNLTPNGIYPPFFTGRIIHAALWHLYYFGQHPVDMVDALVWGETQALKRDYPTLYQANLPTINEQTELCKALLDHYMQWRDSFNGPFNDRNLDFINVEQAFSVPIRTQRGFIAKRLVNRGRLDGVCRSKLDGKLYLWEVKTTKSISQRVKMLDLEEQTDVYMLAVQEMLKEPVAGAIYMLMRKAVPQAPVILKNGMLSQNKQIDTTFAHYLAAIRTHHEHNATTAFIQANYGEMLQHLLDNGNPFFERVVVKRSQAQLKAASRELYAVASEMTNPTIPIYHHGQPGCNWCIFREPCLATQQGNHEFAETLLKNNYRQNDYHLQRSDEE